MGPGRAGGGAVAQGATLLPTLADIRTLLMVGEDIKWRKQAQLKLEGGGENFYTKQKSFEFVFAKEWGGVLSFFFFDNEVQNKCKQADGKFVHLHKSSQDFRAR